MLWHGQVASETPSADEAGTRTEIEYHESTGKVKRVVHLLRGEKDGPEMLYYPSGVLKASRHWKNGKREGEQTTYYPDGQLQSSVRFAEGKEIEGTANGVFKSGVVGGNYPGSTYRLVPYRNGERHGVAHRFYWNPDTQKNHEVDQLAATVPYRNGTIHGTETTYHFRHPNGEMTERYRKGDVEMLAEYVNGVLHGTVKRFFDGQVTYEAHYLCGKRHGLERWYYTGERVKREVHWKLGEKHGLETSLLPDGTVKDKVLWDMGTEVKEK